MHIKLCGEWAFELSDTVCENNGAHKPYAQFLLGSSKRKLKELSMFTWCLNRVIEHVKHQNTTIDTVVELFGGVGRLSLITQEILHPNKHLVMELDENLARHIKTLNYDLTVKIGDAYSFAGDVDFPNPDLILLDVPYGTLKAWATDVELRKFLTNIFALHPRFIELADTSLRYTHLHKELYSKLSGVDITDTVSYFYGLSEVFEQLSDGEYGISSVAYYRDMGAVLIEPMALIAGTDINDWRAEDYPESAGFMEILP